MPGTRLPTMRCARRAAHRRGGRYASCAVIASRHWTRPPSCPTGRTAMRSNSWARTPSAGWPTSTGNGAATTPANGNCTAWPEFLQVLRALQVLTADMAQNQGPDGFELARLMRLLDPRAVVRPLYEQALAHDPQHAGALRGLVPEITRCRSPGQARWPAAPVGLCEKMGSRWWTARTALAELETSRPRHGARCRRLAAVAPALVRGG